MNLEFVDMLNAMRFGKLDKVSIQAFQSLSRSVEYDDGIGPTQLYGWLYVCVILYSKYLIGIPLAQRLIQQTKENLLHCLGMGFNTRQPTHLDAIQMTILFHSNRWGAC
jgi:hypothetical protein